LFLIGIVKIDRCILTKNPIPAIASETGQYLRLHQPNLKNLGIFPRPRRFAAIEEPASGVRKMPIYRLLQNSPLGPDELAILTDGYERTLQKLSLADRNDPLTEIVAKKIIELGQRGVRDAEELSALAIKELGI